MTELGIQFVFEQLEELTKIVNQLAEEQKPDDSKFRNKNGVSHLEWESGGVIVRYSRYLGCNEYENSEKTFTMNQIIEFAESANLI